MFSLCLLSRSWRLFLPCACCRDPGDYLSLVPVCLAALVSGKVFWLGMGGDGFQTEEKVLGVGTGRRKEWTCKFCSETSVWTRWRCRRCGDDISTGLQGKHKQAMYAKNKEWHPVSSSPSGREEWKSQEQEEELKKLRAQVELLSKQQTDYKKKLDEQKKSLQRQLRDIEKLTDMEPMHRDGQKESWKDELQEIERKRTELLLEVPNDAEEVSEAAEFAGQGRGIISKRPVLVGKECGKSMKK